MAEHVGADHTARTAAIVDHHLLARHLTEPAAYDLAERSVFPPGGTGTMKRTGRTGY